ncbi:MAG: hypothetical protein ACK5NA_01665 [Enterococcus sp.]
MSILVILKDNPVERSTFMYIRLKENRTVLQFSPEFHLEGLTLGELYSKDGYLGIQEFFVKELDLVVDDFVEVSLEEWNRFLPEIAPDGLLVEVADGQRMVGLPELTEKMQYCLDQKNEFSIFYAQRKILKSFFKVLSKKRNLLRMTYFLKKYPNLLHTSMQIPQFFGLVHRYLQSQQLPSQNFSFPLTDTYRVVERSHEKKVIVVDFIQNRNKIYQMTLGKVN